MQLPQPDVGLDEASETARSVLSGRAYVEAARPPSLRERFFDWLGDVITELLDALSSGGGRGIVAWIVVGLFLLLIAFLLYRLLARYEPLARLDDPPDPEIDVFADRTAREWMAAAQEHEAAGEWSEGLRCRHRSLSVELIDRGLADGRPGITASALCRQAAVFLPEPEALHDATDLFEAVWYGGEAAGPGTRDRFVADATRVRASLDAIVSVDSPVGAERVGA